jgi:hypothetical protein
MRQTVLDYIVNAPLGRYRFSKELPYEETGTPLHIKNPLTIYVDDEDISETPLIRTLSGNHINVRTTTLDIYFSNDAKNTPNNYGSLVNYLLAAKDVKPGYNSTDSEITTDIQDDLQVTTVRVTYTKIA